MKAPRFLTLLGASAIMLALGTGDLHAQRPERPGVSTGEIPRPSGASETGSTRSSAGIALGPRFRPGATVEGEAPAAELAGITATFEGFGFDDNATENGGFLSIPPDPIGAAGPDRLIAVVNRMIEARTKTGTLLWRDSLADFFAPAAPMTRTFDPKVVYDQFEDRFLVVTLELIEVSNIPDPGNISRILLAVSKTSTPATPTAADWHFFAINSKTTIGGLDHWADYPGFEVDEQAVYITANMFAHVSRGFGGVRLWIVDKGVAGGFYGGGPAVASFHNPYAGGGGIATTTMPAQVFGAGGVGPGIGTFLVSYSGITNGIAEAAQVVRINDPLGTPSFTQEFVDIGDIENLVAALPDAPQSGTATRIEVNDRRALDAVWRNDALWLVTTIEPNSGADAGQTTAHWIRLDTSAVVNSTSAANLISLGDQGDIGGEDIAPNTFTFFPSLAVNSGGDAMFGFSASAATIFAGAFVTGRQAADPAGTVQASATVHAGEDFYVRTFGGSRNRWGDYSGTALDPSDDNVFWVFNEFADTRGTVIGGEDGRWGTAWASSSFTAVAGNDLVVSFPPGDRLWVRLNNATWQVLHSLSPDSLATGRMDNNLQDEVIADFGPGLGLWIWRNNTAWQRLHGASPQQVVTGNLDTGGQAEVIVDFGLPLGLWARFNDSSWVKLHGSSPETMATADMDDNGQDELIAGFGALGLWIWRNNTSWQRLHGSSPQFMTGADLDNDGRDEVVVSFGAPLGLWARFNDSIWVKLNGLSPEAMTAADMDGNGIDEVVGDFGALGLWVWRNNSVWRKLHGTSPEDLVTADLDRSGKDEVVVDFGLPLGLWARFNDTTWVKLNGLSPQAMASGDIDGQ